MRVCEGAACLMLAACSANDDIPAPLVGSVTPDHGVAGSIVRIDGEFFCGAPPDGDEVESCEMTGIVEFATTPSISTSWMATTIMVEVPTGVRGEVDLRVTVGGRHSNDVDFYVD